jgi:hypothetical protein
MCSSPCPGPASFLQLAATDPVPMASETLERIAGLYAIKPTSAGAAPGERRAGRNPLYDPLPRQRPYRNRSNVVERTIRPTAPNRKNAPSAELRWPCTPTCQTLSPGFNSRVINPLPGPTPPPQPQACSLKLALVMDALGRMSWRTPPRVGAQGRARIVDEGGKHCAQQVAL